MVESDLEIEKAENTGANYIQSGNRGSGLHREPSFSRWCDENGGVHFGSHLETSGSGAEDPDFQLPLLDDGQLEGVSFSGDTDQNSKYRMGSMHLSGSSSVEVSPSSVDGRHAYDKFGLVSRAASVDSSAHHDGRHGYDKFVPFDIENRSALEITYSNVEADRSSSSTSDPDILPPNSKSVVSVADVLKTLFFVLVWYTFSTFLTLYNKTLLGDDLGKFPAPLLMNTVHFSMQAISSNAIVWYWSYRFKPTVTMSWKDYFLRVVPTALGTALDINLSNASLVFISVTFATMCKSASPIFLLLFAFAFRLETPSFKLLGIILIISAGILLTVAKETEFEFWGFIFVMMAAVMSGFRWSMTQILLQKESYGLKNPLTLMSYVTPVMAVATALLSLLLDPWYEFKTNNYFNNSWNVARSCLLMLFGGLLAFFMVLTEYILVSVTSAVTVTIAGVVKEAVTIVVAVFYFHDEFTWLKGAGLVTIMFGVSLFNWFKYQKLQDDQTREDLVGSTTTNVPVKYVILEEMDDQDDRT